VAVLTLVPQTDMEQRRRDEPEGRARELSRLRLPAASLRALRIHTPSVRAVPDGPVAVCAEVCSIPPRRRRPLLSGRLRMAVWYWVARPCAVLSRPRKSEECSALTLACRSSAFVPQPVVPSPYSADPAAPDPTTPALSIPSIYVPQVHVADPSVIDPVVMEPSVVEPHVVSPHVMSPHVTNPHVIEPSVDEVDEPEADIEQEEQALKDGKPLLRQDRGPDAPQMPRASAMASLAFNNAMNLQGQRYASVENYVARQNANARNLVRENDMYIRQWHRSMRSIASTRLRSFALDTLAGRWVNFFDDRSTIHASRTVRGVAHSSSWHRHGLAALGGGKRARAQHSNVVSTFGDVPRGLNLNDLQKNECCVGSAADTRAADTPSCSSGLPPPTLDPCRINTKK